MYCSRNTYKQSPVSLCVLTLIRICFDFNFFSVWSPVVVSFVPIDSLAPQNELENDFNEIFGGIQQPSQENTRPYKIIQPDPGKWHIRIKHIHTHNTLVHMSRTPSAWRYAKHYHILSSHHQRSLTIKIHVLWHCDSTNNHTSIPLSMYLVSQSFLFLSSVCRGFLVFELLMDLRLETITLRNIYFLWIFRCLAYWLR